MKKNSLNELEMDYYTETLENGLEVYMVPYENKKNYFISYATRFGSDVVSFTQEDKKKYSPPLGIAHFLEHKMFEQETGEDPFTFFSKSGSDGNASTSFDNTQYICSGNKDFEKNLRYLLRFVNSPYFTDKNVQKEKGIIAEEIKMYNDMPDFKLEMRLREELYKEHPRRMDIAGTIEEIQKITKEDLYKCYQNFYVPNNMFILIVGKFDKEEAIEIIKEELNSKERISLPDIGEIKEPEEVFHKSDTIDANIEVPKIAIGLKVPTKNFSKKGMELDLYLNMLTSILFGSSSPFRERIRNQKLASGLYMEWEKLDQFNTFYFMASTNYPEELLSEIKKELKEPVLDEKTMNRIKKVWISNEVRMIDSIDATVNNLFDDIIKYKQIIPDRIDKIKGLKIKTLKEITSQINFKNISIIKMLPSKEERK